MSLTPIDIQQKTFGPELRGYNMDEVDDFLDEVVTALKEYDQRVRDAQDRIRALEAELSTRGEDESAISRALVAAQKQADAIISDAVAEAQRIQGEAQGEADRLRQEREVERAGLTQDVARMRSTIADLKRRVGELAASVGSELDEMDLAAAGASQEIAGDGSEAVLPDEPVSFAAATTGEDLAPFGDYMGETEEDDDAAERIGHGQHLAPGEEDTADWSDEEATPGEGTPPGEDDSSGEGESHGEGEWPGEGEWTRPDESPTRDGEEAAVDETVEDVVAEVVVEEIDLDEPDAGSGGDVDEAPAEPPASRRPWERGSV